MRSPGDGFLSQTLCGPVSITSFGIRYGTTLLGRVERFFFPHHDSSTWISLLETRLGDREGLRRGCRMAISSTLVVMEDLALTYVGRLLVFTKSGTHQPAATCRQVEMTEVDIMDKRIDCTDQGDDKY
jgi:hypothetical protein